MKLCQVNYKTYYLNSFDFNIFPDTNKINEPGQFVYFVCNWKDIKIKRI